MNPLRRLLFALLCLLPLSATALESHAVVFMYHRFGNARYPSTSVELSQFDAQLDYLAQNGYQVWPLRKILAYLKAGKALPSHTVAITVDDAYKSVYEHAYPRLKARGWPFTVFVNTGPVDRHLPDFMSWTQMREMAAHGVDFANHSADHAHMIERRPGESEAQWRSRMKADVEKAQERLQTELGKQVNSSPPLFAYPYGEYDTALANLLKAMGYVAFGQQSGAIGSLSDRRALPRYPINVHYGAMQTFKVKAASLALPVKAESPWDPVVGTQNPPTLRLTLGTSGARLSQLACYSAEGTPLQLQHLDGATYKVKAATALHGPRNRYNCTAPSAERGRYYWFSHLWIIPPAAAGRDD